jgi:hypothetical protein
LGAAPRLALNSNYSEFVEESAADLPGMFEQLYGHPCPESFKAALYLPDTLAVDWKRDDKVSGEFSLSNLFLTMQRTLDESLQDWTLNGIRLSETRFADAVVLHGGPLFTLVVVSDAGISEQLYLFDTRELYELELDYEGYLRSLSLAKGVVYWQYLFCRGARLGAFEAGVLKQEIAFLQEAFPGRDYQELLARLSEKGA